MPSAVDTVWAACHSKMRWLYTEKPKYIAAIIEVLSEI